MDTNEYSSVVDSSDYDSLFDLDWLTSTTPEAPQLPGDCSKSLPGQTQPQSVCPERFATAAPGNPESSMLYLPQFGQQACSSTPIHSTEQAAGKSAEVSAGQPVGQSSKLATEQFTGQPTELSAGQSAEQSATQSAGQSATQSAGHSAGQSAGQSSGYRFASDITTGASAGHSRKDSTQIVDHNI